NDEILVIIIVEPQPVVLIIFFIIIAWRRGRFAGANGTSGISSRRELLRELRIFRGRGIPIIRRRGL
ncbi:MAG TPA: hypothetical protein VE267_14325, partial [Bradyrhizobium sp.]|nr:hypothetical protein [Bradyrhizobium sp.]